MHDVEFRRAHPADAEDMLSAHLDSIRSIGPSFYPPDVVEAFFIARGHIDGTPGVLGFSTHRVDDDRDGTSVYVRGQATRRGIGSALLRLAEEHARVHGATSIQIQASLAGVPFYKANGFEELGRGEAQLMSGHPMPCVFMRKLLRRG